MNIQNLRNDYLKIIEESENTEIKDYIKQIVEEVLSEMKNVSEDISETKDPSAEIKKELKKAGYELVGKSNALVQTYSKIWQDNPNYVNSHKISVDTVNGTWKASEDKKLKLDAAEGETMNLKSYLDKAAKGMKTK